MVKKVLFVFAIPLLLAGATVKEEFPGQLAAPQVCDSLGRAQRLNKTPLVLVKNGIPQFNIVIAAEPTNAARYAAEELQHHFYLATGKKVQILRGKKALSPLFISGKHP